MLPQLDSTHMFPIFVRIGEDFLKNVRDRLAYLGLVRSYITWEYADEFGCPYVTTRYIITVQ